MKKKIILFDWDDTLFSKTEYKRNLRSNLARMCGVSKEEIFDFEEKYFKNLGKSGDFQIDNFVKNFGQKFGKKIEKGDFGSDKLGIYSKALFPEAISVLNDLKNDFILGIYSQGFVNLQMLKIKSSGIGNFFDEKFIYINRDKLNANFLAKLPDGAIIVDDKREVVQKLEALNRFKVVWVNRKNDNGVVEGVTTVRSLSELVDLVK